MVFSVYKQQKYLATCYSIASYVAWRTLSIRDGFLTLMMLRSQRGYIRIRRYLNLALYSNVPDTRIEWRHHLRFISCNSIPFTLLISSPKLGRVTSLKNVIWVSNISFLQAMQVSISPFAEGGTKELQRRYFLSLTQGGSCVNIKREFDHSTVDQPVIYMPHDLIESKLAF